MKRYDYESVNEEQAKEMDIIPWVKHDEAHAIIKEAYEGIIKSRSYHSIDLVDRAEKWLKENRRNM